MLVFKGLVMGLREIVTLYGSPWSVIRVCSRIKNLGSFTLSRINACGIFRVPAIAKCQTYNHHLDIVSRGSVMARSVPDQNRR